jgi:hypothetical protein
LATRPSKGGCACRRPGVEQGEILRCLQADPGLLRAVELAGRHGQVDGRKAKKLAEVAGFCEVILRYMEGYLREVPKPRIVEFSCGKSYLGIVLAVLMRRWSGREPVLVGVDANEELVGRCWRLAAAAGLQDATFVASRTIDYGPTGPVDVVLALHACDTATDEAIARGITMSARLILVVPCCQNQVRGQIRGGHVLTGMTDFGPVRYRLANLLTDALRAQFLRSAGYHVELAEIVSPRLTPKNLCICARRTRRGPARGRDRDYRALRDFFGVRPALERLCPDVIRGTHGGRRAALGPAGD